MKNIRHIEIYIILILYLFFQFIIYRYIPKLFSQIINPIFLLIVSIYLYFKTNNSHGRFVKNKEYNKKMLIVILTYIIVYLYLGFIFGFVKSPYSHNILTIIKNFSQIILPIICIEYIRSSIINSNINNKIIIILTTLILFMLELNFYSFLGNIQDREEGFEYISSVVIPLFSYSILYSYLSLKGSYKLVLTFRVFYELLFLISPIYPDLDWFATGILGLLVPTIIYVVFKYDFDKHKRNNDRIKNKNDSLISYVPVIGVIVLFTCFMLGLFKYEPIAVVSNSMTPTFYRGDVVILRKVDNNILKNIEKYNIIVYRIDDQQIVHRVVDIIEENGKRYFRTKGDANNSEDSELVSEEQIVGLYKFSIQYIGYPSVWLNDYFNDQTPKVEIK